MYPKGQVVFLLQRNKTCFCTVPFRVAVRDFFDRTIGERCGMMVQQSMRKMPISADLWVQHHFPALSVRGGTKFTSRRSTLNR